MIVNVCAERMFATPPDAVFELALDAGRFPSTFVGCGPIPALRRITPRAAPAVGSTRDVESADGSVLIETITAFVPPQRHAYTLSGLRPPLAWLVRSGDADWTFMRTDSGTHVTWRYAFTLTNPLAWPLASPLLHVFMRGAMQRCLDVMARVLEAREAT
jgi:hypothetical protein